MEPIAFATQIEGAKTATLSSFAAATIRATVEVQEMPKAVAAFELIKRNADSKRRAPRLQSEAVNQITSRTLAQPSQFS